jgi:hypothetical protein
MSTLVLPDLEPLKRKDRVVAALDMPGIPAGTEGKVIMVAGFTWIRYWVRFENGVERGSINRTNLVRPGEPFGPELLELRANAEAPVAVADGGGEAAAAGGGVEVGGVMIPQHLLDRSMKRREAIGA